MYNLRYHLASLVAVFIALAIGLMLGSLAAERGYLDTQQSALIEGLQADFDELRATNDQLRSDFERDHGFAVQISDAFSAGVLEGKTILVIGSEGRSDGLTAVNSAIIGAGGRVVTALLSEPGLGLGDATLQATMAALEETSTPLAERELTGEILRALAAELTTPGVAGTSYLDALMEADVLSMEDWNATDGVDGVVIVASFEEAADPVLLRLGARLLDRDIPAVGVEVSWRDEGIVPAALEAGLSAVDHVDMPQGSLSVVMILAGRADGHYGVREGASGLIPPLGEGP